MTILKIFICIIPLIISFSLCIYLDLHGIVKSGAFHWAVGALGGLLMTLAMMLTRKHY